jgi:hypothetical protein
MVSLRGLAILMEPRRKPRSKSEHGTEGEHLGGDEAQESYGLLVGLNRRRWYQMLAWSKPLKSRVLRSGLTSDLCRNWRSLRVRDKEDESREFGTRWMQRHEGMAVETRYSYAGRGKL